ncbi:AAA family ATPase [Leptobacterium flavescens]|uniref:AAA family ATPase n=1 Tax=Leptobacterium flavescens TaxID=472055 RepID=A0A6P0ULY7_9FLAO|nr:ATP-binding protein [Leptobacterium flavescens]NER12073.1 AAA family ATPase [Leptobacterium flavescens]
MKEIPEYLSYLKMLINKRFDIYFNSDLDESSFEETLQTDLSFEEDERLSKYYNTREELVVLLLGLIPHINTIFMDQVIQEKINASGDFPQIGGVRGKNFRGFIPTGETALFILGGNLLEKRKRIMEIFNPDHFYIRKGILRLEDSPDGEPRMSGKIILSPEHVELLLLGKMNKPEFSLKFPAKIIETEMEWSDLVLNQETHSQIQELQAWIAHGNTLLQDWGMYKKLKPGYRVLFHGPPGTGKTLTATLLGKYTGKDVYKIDLSMVVSKFIGETEKNLANLLARAEKTEDILFFDEADALFGKRTNVRDAHDKYANQEVSYLLQRIESYNGLVILASNLKSNIDEAFVRRFQSIIHFPLPKVSERHILWKKAFPSKVKLHKDVDLLQLAQKYELSGAEIMNIVQYACLCALDAGKKTITSSFVVNGIQREYQKGGRIMR